MKALTLIILCVLVAVCVASKPGKKRDEPRGRRRREAEMNGEPELAESVDIDNNFGESLIPEMGQES